MCRLFGFRSVIPSQVHRSLLSADNALCNLSNQHPDGWGVAFYVEGAPHVTRSPERAYGDQLFHRVSGVVASETVLAHVRKATQGSLGVLNCHPFQYGRWTFAHNGDVPRFSELRPALLARVDPDLARYVLGETDSEVVFFLFLTALRRKGPIGGTFTVPEVASALSEAVAIVRDLADRPGEAASLLTLVVTNGTTMAATMGGKELYYSTHKRRCADRESCASLSPECEAPTRSGRVNHFVVSSEPILGENVWIPLGHSEVVGVDDRMNLHHGSLGRLVLSVVA
ncbi:MAG: class II glutamine amidotransferase [Polyangiales bacterium]